MLVEGAARSSRCSEAEVTAIRRAALLHDLGRVAVPNGIWDSPRPPSTPE